MKDYPEIKRFLEKQDEEIINLRKSSGKAYFDAITSGEEGLYKDYEKKALEEEKYFHNKENFEKVKEFLKKVKEPLEKRQLTILYLAYLGAQGNFELTKRILEISTKVEQIFNNYRAKVGGKEISDNELKDILKNETDSKKLKEAWEANKKQGAIVEKDVILLVKLRNELAKGLGYENYFKMSLELNEQDEEEIDKIFLTLNERTERTFERLKKELDEAISKKCGIEIHELKPWHYQDPFFQEAPEIYKFDFNDFYKEDIIKKAIAFYDNIGFDTRDILEKSDLYEKPKKYQHACCIDIDKQGDVRIVQNTKNNEKWMDTTLHELGHAVYDKYYDKRLPFLLRGSAHIFVTESIALLFGRNSKNSTFIERYCGIEKEKIKDISESAMKQLQMRQIIFLRWCQVMYNFEKEFYKNPEQNLNKLWWELVKKFQKIDFSRDSPDWASKIHLASSPVYYQNYLLGELLASQLQNHIFKEILKQKEVKNSDYSKKEAGEYLKKNIFEQGRKYSWNELIEKATGEKLTPKYFLEDFCD